MEHVLLLFAGFILLAGAIGLPALCIFMIIKSCTTGRLSLNGRIVDVRKHPVIFVLSLALLLWLTWFGLNIFIGLIW